jgi:hypothetical protein
MILSFVLGVNVLHRFKLCCADTILSRLLSGQVHIPARVRRQHQGRADERVAAGTACPDLIVLTVTMDAILSLSSCASWLCECCAVSSVTF